MSKNLPLYKNKCMNCGIEWFAEEPAELCEQCSIEEQLQQIYNGVEQ